jgi:hypothetical protein
MYGTCATQAHAATELRAFEIEFIPQHPKQRHLGVAVNLLVLTVYFQLDHKFSP